MSGPAAIDSLRRAISVLVEHGGDVLPVARAIDDWLARGGDFAAVMGMRPGWHNTYRTRQREIALGELSRDFPGLQGRALARAMVDASAEYQRRRWHADAAAQRRPDGRDGRIYDVLVLGDFPTAETLRKCIG